MAKSAPDAMIDAALDYVASGDRMVVCSTQPTTYTEAMTTYNLATVTLTAGAGNGDFTKADDTSGRKLTMTAKSALPITASGNAQHVAICTVSGSVLRYVTTCTSQALVSGGTVDVPSWKINIADPT